MKTTKIILAAIAVLLIAVFAGALYLATYLEEHKEWLEASVSKALGREVQVVGGVKVHWSMTPSVVLEELWIGDTAWAGPPHLARAKQAIVTFAVIPLFSRRLELIDVGLRNADIYVEQTADGRNNWGFSGLGQGDAGIGFAVRALRVEESSLHYRTPTGNDIVVEVPRLVFGDPGEGEITLEGKLSFRDVPFALSGQAREQAGVGSNARNFSLQASIPDATLVISGDATGLHEFSRLEMELNSDGVDLREWLSKLWPAVEFDGTLKAVNARLQTSGDTLESLTGNAAGALTVGSAAFMQPDTEQAKDSGLELTNVRVDVEPGQVMEWHSGLNYAGQSYEVRLTGGSFEDLFAARETWRKIEVDAKGNQNGRAIAISGELGPWSTEGTGLNLVLKDETLKVGLKGVVAPLPGFRDSRLAVTASAPSLDRFTPWLGDALPSSEPFVFSASLEGGEGRITLSDIKLVSGDSDIGGTLIVPLAKGGRFEANLESRELDLAPYLTSDTQHAAGLVPLLQRELPLDFLHGLDGVMRYRVGNLRTAILDLNSISLDASLADNHLTASLAADNENLSLRANLRPAGSHWRLSLEHQGRLRIGTLIAVDRVDGERPGTPVQTDLMLDASGSSIGTMLDSATGQFLTVVGAGELSDELAPNLLFGDVLLALLDIVKSKDRADRRINVECGVVQLDIDKGIAVSKRGLALRTKNLNVIGAGAWKLRTGEIDLQFKTAHRKGLGISLLGIADRVVRVTGLIHKPEATLNVGGAAVYGAAAWITGGLSVVYDGLFRRLTAFSNPCETVMEKREGQP